MLVVIAAIARHRALSITPAMQRPVRGREGNELKQETRMERPQGAKEHARAAITRPFGKKGAGGDTNRASDDRCVLQHRQRAKDKRPSEAGI